MTVRLRKLLRFSRSYRKGSHFSGPGIQTKAPAESASCRSGGIQSSSLAVNPAASRGLQKRADRSFNQERRCWTPAGTTGSRVIRVVFFSVIVYPTDVMTGVKIDEEKKTCLWGLNRTHAPAYTLHSTLGSEGRKTGGKRESAVNTEGLKK